MGDPTYGFNGITLVTPNEVRASAGLTVSGDRIASLESPVGGYSVDLEDYVLFPGLLNAHDHLLGTWWPPVAPNRPYTNVYEWLDDYEQSSVLTDRGANSNKDIYALGAYRNLISGVTTVADHYKRMDDADFYRHYPIHVLYKYGRSWLPRTYRKTGWGEDIRDEYKLAVACETPYIIHLAEGLDPETAQEMDILAQVGAIGRNTMVIHGVGLRLEDMDLMAQSGASACWCPASNLFLYGRTANIPALRRAGVNITLGTDSTMTGSLNLLDEVRVGRQAFRDQTGRDPRAHWLVELMTTHAAYALMVERTRGLLEPGYEADLLILPNRGDDPYQTLIEATSEDIALVVCGGVPAYGDSAFADLFEQFTPDFTEISVSGRAKLIAGDPVGLLNRISAHVGRPMDFPFLPCCPPHSEDTRQ
jgi:cytosine/adenosine deaminase-related metal-dependent hydrolase